MNDRMVPGPVKFASHVVEDTDTGKHFGCVIFSQHTQTGIKSLKFHANSLQLITMSETLLAIAQCVRLAEEPVPANGKGH